MSVSELLDAMYFGDFSSSTRILSEIQTEYDLHTCPRALGDESQAGQRKPLVIRDHLFNFMDAFPVYSCLDMNSYELLECIADSHSRTEAHQLLLQYVSELLEDDDPRLLQRYIEIEDLAATDFMSLIVDILAERRDEMQDLQIPCSKISIGGKTRARYIISMLASTAYGKRLLDGMGIDDAFVVGDKEWNIIADALTELGCDISKMILDIDESEWSKRTFGISKPSKSESMELVDLGRFRQAYSRLTSPDERLRMDGLKEFGELESVHGLNRIVSIAHRGNRGERTLAIDVLAKLGSSEHEPFFEQLLVDLDPFIRSKAANAITRLPARQFLRDSHYVHERPVRIPRRISWMPIDASKLLEGNKYERFDAAQVYLKLESEEALSIFNRLFGHLDRTQKLKLIDLAHELERYQSEHIIKRALTDPDRAINEAAVQVGRILWPGPHWDISIDTSE